jgi:predicted DNA binding protein
MTAHIATALLDGTDPKSIQSELVDGLDTLGCYDAVWLGNRLDRRPTAAVGSDELLTTLGEIATLPADTDGFQTHGDVKIVPVPIFRALATDSAEEYRHMRAARVPLRHQGLACGVVVVATDRTDAFERPELETLARVGHLAGFALDAAVQRRLLADRAAIEAVLEARADTTPMAMMRLAQACNGTVELDRIIPRDESAHMYLTVPTADVEWSSLEDGTLVREIRVPDTDGEGVTIEAVVTEQSPLASLAASGVAVSSAVADADQFRATIRAGETGPEILRRFRDRFPEVKCVAKRQAATPRDKRDAAGIIDAAGLTRKQHTVLEAALAGGFFERPRERTGADIADSLNISASTFHQHLREALRKVVETTLETRT